MGQPYKIRRDNKSGVTGVYFDNHKRQQYWIASIGVNGKTIKLGRFKDKRKAIIARRIAEKKYNYKPIKK